MRCRFASHKCCTNLTVILTAKVTLFGYDFVGQHYLDHQLSQPLIRLFEAIMVHPSNQTKTLSKDLRQLYFHGRRSLLIVDAAPSFPDGQSTEHLTRSSHRKGPNPCLRETTRGRSG